ncbi:hypothetical protein SERLADRAFT_412419 [Serpula lacrymans var. lacrymans S7.9]|uniref:Uncharacterized protein n=1 Tax=Serpula lacrymans var. lacrymans (strain S7.9) TaxID=578457 RepID=F8NFN8_SERL9|nr:uncharacterized protein SERLADRAFT_412419 [Serpula lacrymans var. lacrymans S7.9]EGO30878.1 hypothetical protein SERLADRAFT_412419 [Serpula lacrymans var. lacrymans S7.9]
MHLSDVCTLDISEAGKCTDTEKRGDTASVGNAAHHFQGGLLTAKSLPRKITCSGRLCARSCGRTVGRAILEGGVAEKVQLAHEMAQTKSLTVSTDKTSHRHVNYESRHISYKVTSYAKNDVTPAKPVVRLLGVESSKNHCSETQLEGLQLSVAALATIYNDSPLAQCTGSDFSDWIFTRKAKGINGDHAADQKKAFWLFQAWKSENLLADLGNNALSENPALSASFSEALDRAKHQLVAEAGGLECWNSLLPSERTKLELTMKSSMVRTLGQDAYLGLSETEKHEAEFLIRAGCCMHKELNAVKGGNDVMMAKWDRLGVEGPVLLANKDNDATLQGASHGADCEPTPAEVRALNESNQGAVKAISLAGGIFNNKDKKKGQHDTYCWYMENRGLVASQFPDTSNVRFQSHIEAAEVVLTDHQAILEFLEFVRDKKDHWKLNHMELNLYKALHCSKTMTEVVAIVIYGGTVLHPYSQMVRGPGTESLNVLDLGPLHEELKKHLKVILTNPKLIFGANVAPETACFGGRPWEHSTSGSHSQLNLHQAAHDQASTEERDAAWMPATNDANEGALGAFRLRAQDKPTLSMHQHNSFVDATFTSEDFCHAMRLAREIDRAGLEKNRRLEIIWHEEGEVQAKRQRVAERQQKEAQKTVSREAERNATVMVLTLNEEELNRLTKDKLIIQLEIHRVQESTIPRGLRSMVNKDLIRILIAQISVVLQQNVHAASASGPCEQGRSLDSS